MILRTMVTLVVFILPMVMVASAIETGKGSNTNNVGEFVGQLTSLLNQGALLQGAGQQGSVLGYQSPGNYPPGPYPPPPYYRPGPPPGQPYPDQYPPPYQQFPGGYPGQGLLPPAASLFGALSSIARFDDARCVPRLLCEVASGARPGSYGGYPSYSEPSPLPFLSKEALVTLLTVLNFVDDSPLLVFGRAALLGYTARGDSRACLVAYPTCPRDPDRLVDYLNNHNGGFFRFFNQQLPQYAPQYQQYQPHYPPPYPQPYPPQGQFPPQGPYPPQGPPYPPQQPPPYNPQGPPFPPQRPPYPQRPHRPSYPPPQYPQQYSAQNQRYQSRIQSQPESVLEYNYYTSSSTPSPLGEDPNKLAYAAFENQLSGQDFSQVKQTKTRLIFPEGQSALQNNKYQSSRGGKSFFPSEGFSKDQFSQNRLPVTMVFPQSDRTGTGNLRLDVDEHGTYKTVYFAPLQHRDRDLRQVSFPHQQTMHFPH